MTELPGYDNWLARYERHTTTVWCDNPACTNHTQGVTVLFQSEYGQGWLEPEECGCGGDWVQDQPEDTDE
jgi:hypothetical protein